MDAVVAKRPQGLMELGPALGAMFRDEDVAASIAAFRPRPSDVVISPYGKCGTTWLQQIFHTLRTGGDMDFDDISRVVPWIETSKLLGLDVNAEQRAEPRGFKSHLAYDQVPKGCRYIVSLRDPKDAFVSLYRFMEGWFFEPGTVTIEQFAMVWLARGGGQDYWHHLATWWEQRGNPAVLLLSYEQMSAEPEATIRRVAGFCGIPLDEALLALTLERSSLPFMLAHKDRFDDRLMREASERVAGLPPGSDSAKVRKGGSGSGRQELPAEVAEALDAKWAELVAPKLGFGSYAELEAALRAR